MYGTGVGRKGFGDTAYVSLGNKAGEMEVWGHSKNMIGCLGKQQKRFSNAVSACSGKANESRWKLERL